MLLSTLNERLEFIQKKLGGSARVEELTGVSVSQQSRMIRGDIKNPSVIQIGAMARAAGVSLDWLVFGTGEPELGAIGESGVVCLEEFNTAAPSPFSFQIDYLSKVLGLNPRFLCMSYCDEDNMEPTIRKGGYALIDREEKSGDGLFLIAYGSLGIRRLQNHSRQKVELISDNKAYTNIMLDLSETTENEFQIIGKVMMILQP